MSPYRVSAPGFPAAAGASEGRPAASRPRHTAVAVALAAAGAGAVALPAVLGLVAPAGASVHSHAAAAPVMLQVTPTVSSQLSFTTLDDSTDLTFNQLLGINDLGKIAGYYGSGADAQHPNKGFTLSAYSGMAFTAENYPGSAQTQVTGLNDMGKTVGFWVDAAGDNNGFWFKNGQYQSFSAPGAAGKTKTTQLLGVNNEGMAVGFYNDADGNSHAFTLNTKTGAYAGLRIPHAVSAMATGVNDDSDIVGTLTTAKKFTESFLLENGAVQLLAVPGASATQAFGVNDLGEVVGQYTAGKATHGFLWRDGKFVTVDDPAGIGSTTVNGINNVGDLVGFYTDAKGNTDGFVAQPQYLRNPGA
jgi:probable HAF family extracellular repeat protein